MAIASLLKFDIKVTGDESETVYEGVFTTKTKLSMRDRLREDELRRMHLGMSASEASQEAYGIAFALAFLGVRITDAPKWWKDANNGVDLVDLNVVSEVYKKCSDEINKEYEKLTKAATEAQKELSKELTKGT